MPFMHSILPKLSFIPTAPITKTSNFPKMVSEILYFSRFTELEVIEQKVLLVPAHPI